MSSGEAAGSRSASFGRIAAGARSARELLSLEREQGLTGRFADLDSLLGSIIVSALKGERPVSAADHAEAPVLALPNDCSDKTNILNELFSLQEQRSRGAWWLPEQVAVRAGIIHFAANLREHGRFAHSFALEERYKVATEASPEAVFAHAVLNPLFAALYEPFGLRGEQTAKLKRESQIARWEASTDFFKDLGFEVEEELSAMRYGSGWSKLTASERLNAKEKLSRALAEQVEAETASRYRAHRLLTLLQRYYSKADSEGKVLARKVLTRDLELTISGFFGGGWLNFLKYLGEGPHPEEQVITALPETKLLINPSERAQKAQSKAVLGGVDQKHLSLIVASLYGSEKSPVERRTETLKGFWEIFDDLHARQESGMPSLWGLIEDFGRISLDHLYESEAVLNPYASDRERPHRSGLYRKLLPATLQREIEELWGTTMLTRYPGRIVTEPFPHARVAEAFGPALKFWEGAALTAWFLCEGPYSRTDMEGLAVYHDKELTELAALGTPVDEAVFEELKKAQKKLGRQKEVYRDLDETEAASGIVIRTSMSSGYRREGFQGLRDAVTRCRRAWAEDYLEGYLKARPEGQIRETATAYNVATQQRGGKPPTPKQFAKVAERATNLWFGGDMANLYRAFGEKPAFESTRVRLLPNDIESFAADVYWALGGEKLPSSPHWELPEPERESYGERRSRERARAKLAARGIDYVQLEEALGRPPTFKEFGRSGFEYEARAVLGQEAGEAYPAYASAVEKAVRSRLTREREATKGEPDDLAALGGGPPGSEKVGPLEQSTAAEPFDSRLANTPPSQERSRRSWWRRLLNL